MPRVQFRARFTGAKGLHLSRVLRRLTVFPRLQRRGHPPEAKPLHPAAMLFGASTPCAKLLLGPVGPQWLAGLLYLGSGVGRGAWALLRRAFGPGKPQEAPLVKADLPWLGGAILAGGVAAPVLLMFGLRGTPASSASLLLNLEGVFTAALAWFAFRENFDRRIFAGMAAILASGTAGRARGSVTTLLRFSVGARCGTPAGCVNPKAIPPCAGRIGGRRRRRVE